LRVLDLRLRELLPRAASARFATDFAALRAVLPVAFASFVALLAVVPADAFTDFALFLAALRRRVATPFFAAALRCALV
jgi:hypothetical protein